MGTRQRPADLLPLPTHVLQILLSLLERPQHGYAILKEIEARTGGEMRLGTSTLYAALRRLSALGLIVETDAPPETESDDARRRYYGATRFGREVVAAEARRVRRLSEMLDRIPALSSAAGRGGGS
jgi:DNA-binding PadR family transcriptional regulator